MNQQQRQLISRFIKRYSTDNGTESMLDYVAGTNGLLGACKDLFDINGAVEHTHVDWFYQECSRYSVAPNSFADAVTQMLAIFNGSYENQDHYATLGLTAHANADEVKSAYRKLSLLHHPDRAVNNETYDSQIFININKAYRAITEPEKCNLQNFSPESKSEWNAIQKRTISVNQKKKLIYWGLGMVAVLLVMIVVGSINVRKRAMLAGLTEDRGAFVPPQEVVQEIPDKFAGRDDVALAKEESIPLKPLEPKGKVSKEVKEAPLQVEEDAVVTSVRKNSNVWVKPLPKHNEIIPEVGKKPVVEVELDHVEAGDVAIVQHHSINEDEKIVLQIPLQEDSTIQSDDLANKINAEAQPQSGAIVQNEAIVQNAKKSAQTQKTALIGGPESEEVLVGGAVNDKNGNFQSVETGNSQETNLVDPNDQQKQIDKFFTEYQKTYAERNIISFSRYFSPDAIENDKPFTEMIPVYANLFESTTDVSLKINVLFWQKLDEGVQVEGRFSVNLKYKKGRESNGVGSIAFFLRREESAYKIESLDYKFD